MFGKLKKKLGGGVNRFSGNTDFLEAVCASAALTAFADGDCSDGELSTAIKTVASNPELTGAFKPAVIEKTMDQMMTRAQAGRTGRMGLYKEIGDIDDQEMSDTVYLCALDIAESDGDVCDKEKAVLTKIASTLGVNTENYDV